MVNLLKRYWLLVILAAIAITLGLSIFKQAPATTPQPPPSLTPQPKSKFGQLRSAIEINYSGPEMNIPTTLPTYTSQTEDAKVFVQTLVEKMNLKPHAVAPNLWIGQSRNLNFDPSTNSIIISAVSTAPTTQGINQTKALNQAVDFVNSIGIENMVVDKANILLIGQNREYINAKPANNLAPEKAYYAIIPFHFQLNTYPLYYNDLPATYLSAIVTNTGVIKATINPSIKFSPSSAKQTITLLQALDRIRQGEGTFLYVDTKNPGSMMTDNLIKINLNQSYLEYRLKPDSTQINPYWRFVGTGTTDEDKEVDLEIIVSAVAN